MVDIHIYHSILISLSVQYNVSKHPFNREFPNQSILLFFYLPIFSPSRPLFQLSLQSQEDKLSEVISNICTYD